MPITNLFTDLPLTGPVTSPVFTLNGVLQVEPGVELILFRPNVGDLLFVVEYKDFRLPTPDWAIFHSSHVVGAVPKPIVGTNFYREWLTIPENVAGNQVRLRVVSVTGTGWLATLNVIV